jgi:glycosyltransferase involved in cell wall biosynthesis
MNIALRLIGGPDWHGGVQYILNIAHALLLLPDKHLVYAHIDERNAHVLKHFIPHLGLFDGVAWTGRHSIANQWKAHIPLREFTTATDFDQAFDVLFPILSDAAPEYARALSWIPDFQHRYLPEFFDQAELARRDANFAKAARLSTGLVLSSEAARSHLDECIPDHHGRVAVLPFHSPLDYDASPESCQQAQEKYGLPERYFMCINQFWTHKDHRTLFEAMKLLKEEGKPFHVVCTGARRDYRDQEHFQRLLHFLDTNGLRDQVQVVGLIPRADQIQLLRGSCGVVQPSLFEGWSTVLEDCRALGLPLIASDIQVHKEQNPAGTHFFQARNAQSLADVLWQAWLFWKNGPDLVREAKARQNSEQALKAFGQRFVDIVHRLQREWLGNVAVPHTPPTCATPRISIGVDPDELPVIDIHSL